MTTTGKEPFKLSTLFCPVRNKPMEFVVIIDNLLHVELKRVLKYIEDGGGIFHGFDPEDKFIVLADKKYKAPPDLTVFDIKYVKRCVKEKKLLDLRHFQISGKVIKGPRCFSFHHLAEADRCTHCLTPEQVLSRMLSLKPKREPTKIQQIMNGIQLKMKNPSKAQLERYHFFILAEVQRLMEQN